MNNQENIGIKKELEKQQKVQTVVTTLLLGNNCYNFFEVQYFYNLIEKYEKMEDLENNQEFKELSEDRKEFLLGIRKIKEEYKELTDKEFKFMLKHYYNPLDYLKENPSLEPRVGFIYYNNNGNEEKQKELEETLKTMKEQGINPIVYDIQLIKSLKNINIKETIKDSYLLEIKKVKKLIEYKNVFDAELLKFESDFYPLTNEKYDNLKNKISEIMIKTGSDLTVRHILKTMEYMKFTQELLFEKNIKNSIEEYNKISININENEKIDFMKSKLIKIFGENFKYRIEKSTSLNFQGDILIENIDNKTIEELFKSIILNDQNLKNEYYDQNLDLLRYQNIVGAGLHDIGKIVVGQEILDGAVKYDDFSVRHQYTLNSHDDFSKFFINSEFKYISDFAAGHHGKLKLKDNDKISMITMVDMFDALVSPRSYKSGVLLENDETKKQKNLETLNEVLGKLNNEYGDIKINDVSIIKVMEQLENKIAKLPFKDNEKEYLEKIILFSQIKNIINQRAFKTKGLDENEEIQMKHIFDNIKNYELKADVSTIILGNSEINFEMFEIFIENFDLYKIKFLENLKLNIKPDIQYFKEKEKSLIKEINEVKMEEIDKLLDFRTKETKELQDILQTFFNLDKSKFENLDKNLNSILDFLTENKFEESHKCMHIIKYNNISTKNEDVKNEDVKNEDVKNEDVKNEDVKNEDVNDELSQNIEENEEKINKKIIQLKENPLFYKIAEIVNLKYETNKENNLAELNKNRKKGEPKLKTEEEENFPKLYSKLKEYFVNSTAMEENLNTTLDNLENIKNDLINNKPKLINIDKEKHLETILEGRKIVEKEINEFINSDVRKKEKELYIRR